MGKAEREFWENLKLSARIVRDLPDGCELKKIHQERLNYFGLTHKEILEACEQRFTKDFYYED